MEIKFGKYALYKGKEYRIVDKRDGTYSLVSHDPKEKEKGFIPHELDASVLIKKVKLEDLEKAYYVTTYTEYKGYKFSVSESKEDGMCALFTGNSKEAEELGFELIDRMSYWKSVKLQDLTKIWEELEPIWGFEGEKEIRILKG
jgi:hypothetical protein